MLLNDVDGIAYCSLQQWDLVKPVQVTSHVEILSFSRQKAWNILV